MKFFSRITLGLAALLSSGNLLTSTQAEGISHAHDGFVLITSLYNETNAERAREYIYCLERNLQHPCIDTIHVIYDTSKDITRYPYITAQDQVYYTPIDIAKNPILSYLHANGNSKIKVSYTTGRPLFSWLFSFINKLYTGKKVIISNADIYFEDSLKLLNNYNLTNKLLSLTRWDVTPSGELRPCFSENGHYGADTWIFAAPIRKFKDLSFALGTLGCDGRLIYQAYKSGITLLNPCKDIKCCHMHITGIHNYSLEEPENSMAWVRAGTLEDTSADVVILQECQRFTS
jgi:hypothetical protein